MNLRDGHGSVRALTDTTGTVTDTYDYDAFGNLLHSTGTTPNNYLFSGEQFDPDLGLYYNRARYLNTSTGRFWSMDTYEGVAKEPASLHKYLYVGTDPINSIDPSGRFGMEDVTAALGVISTLAANIYVQASTVLTTVYLNLWRVPLIVDQVAQYVTLASGAISIVHSASQALPELTHNLLESDQEYSSNPRTRGFQVEVAAGANLSRTNADFDDFRYGELTQIKSTIQVQTKQLLIGLIRRAAQDLGETRGPYRLVSRGGGVQTYQEEQVTGKNLLFVISDEALTFAQQELLPAIEDIEETSGVRVALQAVQNLRGQP
jgi:RHS repeat-associated protein